MTEKRGALALEWGALEGRRSWQRAREGAYLLRTNLPPEKPEKLWTNYIQLTEAEAAPKQKRGGKGKMHRNSSSNHAGEPAVATATGQ